MIKILLAVAYCAMCWGLVLLAVFDQHEALGLMLLAGVLAVLLFYRKNSEK